MNALGIRFQIIKYDHRPVMRIYYYNKEIGHIASGVASKKSTGLALGYHIDESFRNKGIMREALRFYIDNCGVNCLQACVKQSNVASIQILARCGFNKIDEYEGTETIFVFERQVAATKTA